MISGFQKTLFLFSLFVSTSALATEKFPRCFDQRGQEAKIILDPKLNDIMFAEVGPAPRHEPIIRINLKASQQILKGSEEAFRFFYFHECGHLQAVHRVVLGMKNDLENENAADVWALRELTRLKFKPEEFEKVFAILEGIPSSDPHHMDGPLRVKFMRLTLDHFKKKGLGK